MKSKCLLVDAIQFTANYNACLMDALAKKGVEVIYATTVYPYAESPVPPGVKVRYCFFYLARIFSRITSSNTLRRILRAIEYPVNLLALIIYVLINRIKLVHYMWPVLPVVDLVAIEILKLAGCRIIHTCHEPCFRKPKALCLSYICIYRQMDHIITLTEFTRNELTTFAKVPSANISVIPHGDFDYVLSQYPCNEALAEKVQHLANGKKVITFLGAIKPGKGLEYFIRAFSSIKRLNPNTFFLIAGSARFAKQKQLEELLSESCDPSDLYVDLRYFPTSDLKAYLSVADVLVEPYLDARQSGNTVMAYSAGIPVICTNVGGLGEMVEDGRSGYVVPPRDSQAIAEAVSKCLEEDNYARLSENARRLVVEKYNWQDIAAQTIDVYHQLDEMIRQS